MFPEEQRDSPPPGSYFNELLERGKIMAPRLQKTLYIELKQLTPLLIGKATTLYYFEII